MRATRARRPFRVLSRRGGRTMRERTLRRLWFGGALVLAGGAGLSAGNAADGPQNSHRAVFGVGWECDWGYRREGNGCAPVDLPENAHITAAGNIWEIGRAHV